MIPAFQAKQLSFNQPLTVDGKPISAEVGDFWKWAYSDLLMNKTRGVLAEFIVAKALGLDLSVRNAWSHHDLVTKNGTSIEVKASGYLQSWEQKELSKPSWSGLKSRNYDDTAFGEWGHDKLATPKGSLLVLCLHTAQNPETVNPMEMSQWRFWTMPSTDIKENSIGHSSIKKRFDEVDFRSLKSAVARFEDNLSCDD